jgi:hypothetical protein
MPTTIIGGMTRAYIIGPTIWATVAKRMFPSVT